jgi:NhaA family Na+:H+ antiporter
MPATNSHWLSRPVDPDRDHILGPANAEITLVHYGSYGCARCDVAIERVSDMRDHFGDRLRYVFRHCPAKGNDIARRAAELAEVAATVDRFWEAHVALMARGAALAEDDLRHIAHELHLPSSGGATSESAVLYAQQRVDADIQSAAASGVVLLPTFFINERRYTGPWDDSSFAEALEGSLAHRVRAAALDFARWAPSTGILLLVATLLAVVLTNSPLGPAFIALWEQDFGLTLGENTFRMSLLQWVNDGLLSLFFLTVGLEIKREFTVGHLSTRKSAALPIAAAIGGMVVPILLYRLVIPNGPWAHGWGIPMTTDTAFAVALIVMMGTRVPIELRIFLTAAAIVDDIAAILVVALFYSSDLNMGYLAGAGAMAGLLALLNRWGVYRAGPYALVAIGLWSCVYAAGLHATLAAVILALFIPTRPPANLTGLMAQVNAIAKVESRRGAERIGHSLSTPALNALGAIHARLESPAARMLRHVEPWSSYFVLPLFALANAGVVVTGGVWAEHAQLMGAIMLGLVVGKPLGLVLAAGLAVRLGIATKPDTYSWTQIAGAGVLAGIGFTMSLFIAGQALPLAADFAAAKIAIFMASIVAAIIGVLILWKASSRRSTDEDHRDT